MPKTCLIIAGGEYFPFEPPRPGTFVIACDRGYENALRRGVKPDLLISDFDSYAGPVDPAVALERHPIEKDDTDTMLAVRRALALGCSELDLVCALGGRLDHTLANIQTLAFARLRGADAVLRDERTALRVMAPGTLRLKRREGWGLSLFSLGDACEGLSLRGVKYPLEKARLTNGFPLGVSNKWAAPEAEIRLESGLLLVVEAKL